MLGYIRYGDGPKRPETGLLRLPAGTMAVLTLREERWPMALTARRRAMRGAELLLDQGVRRAVFPLDFPYTAAFIRRGICPVETLPLERRLAASAVRRRLDGLGLDRTRASAAVSAGGLDQYVMDTVRDLALSYRYVLLWTPEGGSAFARQLRREYGASILTEPGAEQLDRADALTLFAPRGDLALKNPVLYTLYPGGGARGLGLRPPAAIREWADPNCDMGQLAAALHSLGAVTAEQLLAEIPC